MKRIALVVCLALLFPLSSLARQATHADSLATRFSAVPTDYVTYYSIIMGKEASIINSVYHSGRTTASLLKNSRTFWELGMIPNQGDTLYTSRERNKPLLVVPKVVAQLYFIEFLKIVRGNVTVPESQKTAGPLERLRL